jgi:hypothetical protein
MSEGLISLQSSVTGRRNGNGIIRTPGGTQGVIAALTVVGLISGWVATIYTIEQSIITVSPDHKFVMNVEKGAIYYGAHGMSICFLMAAGVLAALDGCWKVLSPGARLAFSVLLIETVLWATVDYNIDELLSSKIFGATGPFVWLSLLIVFAGVKRNLWVYLSPTIQALAYASALLGLLTFVTLGFASYQGASQYTEYTKLLMWFGGWTLLGATRITGWRLVVRLFPTMCLIPIALCSQSRSLAIDSFLLVFAFVILRAREKGSMARAVPLLVAICGLQIAAALVIYAIAPQTIAASVSGLNARLTEDTRTGQYRDFFAVVPVTDLLLGRGPKGTWYWASFGEYQFFDNGYIWMLFIGGVPTLVCYLKIVVWPSIEVFRMKLGGEDGAALALTGLWGICLAGLSVFTLPGVEVDNFIILLFVGRCHLLCANRAIRSAAGGRRPIAV